MTCNKVLIFSILLCSFSFIFANTYDNEVHDDPLSNILGSFASIVNNYQNEGNANILNGLGSFMNNVDSSLVGNVLSFFGTNQKQTTMSSDNANILQSMLDIMRLSGINLENIVGYLPTIISTFNSFTGPEAEQREKMHKDHEKMLPPFIEYLHLIWDHFTSSQLYKSFINNYDFAKYVQLITNDKNEIDYEKLLILLENRSYREYWINTVADKINSFVNYVSDRDLQNQIMESFVFMINSILKSQQYPLNLNLDLNNKVDSISNLINYFINKNFNYKVDAKVYVKPSMKYLEEMMASGRHKAYFFGSSDFTKSLSEILNNEIIEPIVRVYRASKFIKERPKCTFYVLCTINQPNARERIHLPGVKLVLTKGSSIAASWFISRSTQYSFMTLYNVVMADKNCKLRYLEECAEFHEREYQYSNANVHNEL